MLLSRWAPTEVKCGGVWVGRGLWSTECCPGTLCLLWGIRCLLRILLGQFRGEDVVLLIPSWVGNLW